MGDTQVSLQGVKMKEALLEPLLRTMRLNKVLPTIKEFDNPRVLDIGCGWEAKLLKEISPYIAQGVGIDFKAPNIQTDKIRTFSYYFEPKWDSVSLHQSKNLHATQASVFNGGGGYAKCKSAL